MVDKIANLFASLKPDAAINQISPNEANCGVIMTSDGSVRAFLNTNDLPADPNEWSEGQIEMARKLTAVIVALGNEQLMAILYDVIDNTEVLDLI